MSFAHPSALDGVPPLRKQDALPSYLVFFFMEVSRAPNTSHSGMGADIIKGTIISQDLKDSKKLCSEKTKIPRPTGTIKQYSICFKNMFDVIGFT